MNNKTKKILASIATLIIFLIAGYFYLSAPEDNAEVSGGGDDYEYSDSYQEEEGKLGNDAGDIEQSEAQDITETTQAAVTENNSDTQNDAETEAATEVVHETNSEKSEAVTYQFRKQQYLEEHFAKHGEEFDYETAEEYLAGANRVINDPNSLYKTEAEDGDHIYYLESSNEFVVVSTDGYIRTYFKPSGGIDYYNRQ